MKAAEHYFLVVLFIMLYKVVTLRLMKSYSVVVLSFARIYKQNPLFI